MLIVQWRCQQWKATGILPHRIGRDESNVLRISETIGWSYEERVGVAAGSCSGCFPCSQPYTLKERKGKVVDKPVYSLPIATLQSYLGFYK